MHPRSGLLPDQIVGGLIIAGWLSSPTPTMSRSRDLRPGSRPAICVRAAEHCSQPACRIGHVACHDVVVGPDGTDFRCVRPALDGGLAGLAHDPIGSEPDGGAGARREGASDRFDRPVDGPPHGRADAFTDGVVDDVTGDLVAGGGTGDGNRYSGGGFT